jgi:hypothetical protein
MPTGGAARSRTAGMIVVSSVPGLRQIVSMHQSAPGSLMQREMSLATIPSAPPAGEQARAASRVSANWLPHRLVLERVTWLASGHRRPCSCLREGRRQRLPNHIDLWPDHNLLDRVPSHPLRVWPHASPLVASDRSALRVDLLIHCLYTKFFSRERASRVCFIIKRGGSDQNGYKSCRCLQTDDHPVTSSRPKAVHVFFNLPFE